LAELNKLNVSLQRPDKNMFDVSNKITAFIKQLHLWKEDIANVSGNYQRFAFLYNLLEKKCMMLPSNLRSIFLQHPSKFESKFSSVLSGEFIKLSMNLQSLCPSCPIVLC